MSPKKIHEVPYHVFHELCRILDTTSDPSKNWRSLASIIGVYKNVDIAMFEKEFQKPDGSACRFMLNDWAMTGANVDELFTLIYKIGNIEAFELLKSSKYVSKSLARSLTLVPNTPQPPAAIPPPARNPYDSRSIVQVNSPAGVGYPGTSNKGNMMTLSVVNEQKAGMVTDTILEDLRSKNLIEFSYDEVCSATKYFDETSVTEGGCKIGVGSFGTVYRGLLKNTTFAIKRLLLQGDCQARSVGLSQFAIEVTTLSKYRHPNLLELAGYSLDPRAPCLVYYYMEKGSLASVLSRDAARDLVWKRRLIVAEDVAKGLVYLHTALDKPLIHRDLKSANVLLTDNFQAKIGDFGLARIGSEHQNSVVKTNRLQGTMGYISPEAALGNISIKIDIYSLGVLYLELLLNLPAFDRSRGYENQTLVSLAENMISVHSQSFGLSIGRHGTPWPEKVALEFLNLSQKCFLDHNNRPTANHVLDNVKQLISKYENGASFENWLEPVSHGAVRPRDSVHRDKRTIVVLTESRDHNALIRDKIGMMTSSDSDDTVRSSLRSLDAVEFHFVTLRDAIVIVANPHGAEYVGCVNEVINRFNPDLILNVGLCHGVRGRTSLGDIVICSEVTVGHTSYPLSKVLSGTVNNLVKGERAGTMLWQLPGTMPRAPLYSSSQMLLYISKILLELDKPTSDWLDEIGYDRDKNFLDNMATLWKRYPELGALNISLFFYEGTIVGPDVNLKVAVNKYNRDVDMVRRKCSPRLHVGCLVPDTLPYKHGMAFERYRLCPENVLGCDNTSTYLYRTCAKTQIPCVSVKSVAGFCDIYEDSRYDERARHCSAVTAIEFITSFLAS